MVVKNFDTRDRQIQKVRVHGDRSIADMDVDSAEDGANVSDRDRFVG